MTFNEHATTFGGKTVVDFPLGGTLSDPAATVPRIRCDYEDEHSAVELLSQLLEQPNADELTGLVIGAWVGEELYDVDSSAIVESLVASAPQLPNLRHVFLGDIIYEENEVSWINQSEVSPLLTTFDRLETLQVRGSNGLSVGTSVQHDHLKSLIIECGGLPVSVLKEIEGSNYPALERLELYLGTEEYGWDGSVSDLAKILAGELFPNLKYLGLRDSQIADEVAAAVTKSPLLERIEVLDLSLGTLSDAGAEALVNCPAVAQLAKLDLHHHYLTDGMIERVRGLGIEVDVSDKQEGAEEDRYVAVGE